MEKQYKITTIGAPNIEKMSTLEQKSFYSTLLSLMTEYYRTETKDNATTLACTETANGTNSG